jgi:hypothetical protein
LIDIQNGNKGGVINTGHNSNNLILNMKKEYQKADDIYWDTLNKEIDILKLTPDSTIKSLLMKQEGSKNLKLCNYSYVILYFILFLQI